MQPPWRSAKHIAEVLPATVHASGVIPVSLGGLVILVAWLLLFNYINVFLSEMITNGATGWHFAFYVGFFGVTAVIIGISLVFYNPAPAQVTSPELLDFAKETFRRRRFRYKIITEDHELERVNSLTAQVFGDHHPDWDRIRRIFSRNNRKSVVLVEYVMDHAKAGASRDRPELYLAKSGGRGQIRGFASVWPLTDAAGEQMALGRLNEEQIEVEEVLGKERNSEANYLYITGIADVGSRAWHGDVSGLAPASAVSSAIITVGLMDLLIAEFFRDARPRHVIMIKDTEEGGNVINYFTRRLPRTGYRSRA